MVALHSIALAGGEGWSTDFAAAQKQAAASSKDLLIDFTGSDWCGWCIKLNDEVFKHEAFKAGVKDSFVLVELDYPKDKSKLAEATQKQNAELAIKYPVTGYPTILLCDAAGRPYAATGYREGGPVQYIAHLNTLRGNKAKRDEALAAANKAQGVAKAKALIGALAVMELSDEMVAQFYGEVAGQITAADPKDETGFGKKAAAKKRLLDFQEALQELAGKRDLAGGLALIDKTLQEGGFEVEDTLKLMMTRAVILAQQGKFDEALKAVDAAKAFAPGSPMTAGIDGFRKNLEEGKKKAAAGSGNGDAKPEGGK